MAARFAVVDSNGRTHATFSHEQDAWNAAVRYMKHAGPMRVVKVTR